MFLVNGFELLGVAAVVSAECLNMVGFLFVYFVCAWGCLMTNISCLAIPTIVICTEPEFEWKSRLLVRSIRKFGGRVKDTYIVSYSPRSGKLPSCACQDEFDMLNVQMVFEPLNKDFESYGLANKIVALAHAEKTLPFRPLLFLDSDKVILREPSVLLGLGGRTFAARPVDVRNCGAADFDSGNGGYWKSIHCACGVSSYRYVETTIEREVIVEYYNSGMIFASANMKLLGAWLQNFRKVWHSCSRPSCGDFFVEQSVLASTVSSLCDNVFILPDTYNVPIHLYGCFPHSDWRARLSQCVSVHYHGVFDRGVFLDTLKTFGSMLDADKYDWLTNNLDELSQP
ncbi:hypothetical protein [Fundidesulfovibrio soli]|uniref:hypothetical protein n=1 Tax=Fundidesulfovibrio soli TaxID=2922716 RepID=UPI001FB031CA|nr:hypothetical protein [Fundidesulfovibrio soli]